MRNGRGALLFGLLLIIALGVFGSRFDFAERSDDSVSVPKKISLRYLPYPFTSAVSVADDVDSSTWVGDKRVQEALFDRFGFNLGRSMHAFTPLIERDSVLAFTNSADGGLSNSLVNDGDFPNSSYYLLRSFHQGGIAYLHMWSELSSKRQKQMVVANDAQLTARIDEAGVGLSAVVPVLRPEPIHFPGLKMFVEVDHGITGFAVHIENRNGQVFKVCFGDYDKKGCVWKKALPEAGKRSLKAFFFVEDAIAGAYQKFSPLEYKWKNMWVEAVGKQDSSVSVSEVLYSAFNRALVKRQLPIFDQYNIGFWSYSDHGGVDNGVNIFKQTFDQGERVYYQGDHWSFKDALTNVQVKNTAQGGRPWSDYYFSDLTEKIGASYYLFGNDKAPNYKGLNDLTGYSLDDLLKAYTLPSGRKIYNVRRYFPGIWREGSPGLTKSITWNPRFGQVVDDILNRIDHLKNTSAKRIFGPIITHLGYAGDSEKLGFEPHAIEKKAFNEQTTAALEKLSNRFYNFSGDVANSKRVWVVSINRLYRYTQVKAQIASHIVVGDDGVIRIRRWRDSVTGELMLKPGKEGKDLAGITVYVPDSDHVNIEIQGQPFFDFTRNKEDESGQESITFVDSSARYIVADEVWDGAVLAREDDKGKVEIKQGDTPSGNSYLAINNDDDRDIVIKLPASLNYTSATTHFAFWARADSVDARLTIKYVLKSGREYAASIGGQDAHWIGNWSKDTRWRRFVFNLSDAQFSKENGHEPPRGEVVDISLTVSPKSVISIDDIVFYRDNPYPQNKNTFLVSGRLSSLADSVDVFLHVQGEEKRRVETSQKGYFLFSDVAPRSVVKIEAIVDGKSWWYGKGVTVEVGANLVEMDISIDPWREKNKYQKQYGERISWLSGLVPQQRVGQRRLKLVKSKYGDFRTYQPNRLVSWWGLASPQEYDTYQYANNLGFLDQDREIPQSQDEDYNILLFGDCLFSGAQFPTKDKISVKMQRRLQEILKIPVQTPLLGLTSLTPYHHYRLYDTIGAKYKPKVVFVSVMMSTFRNASPSLRAEEQGLKVGAYPDEMLDVAEDGKFFVRPPDSRYFLHKFNWERDWKGGTSHQFSTYEMIDPWMRVELNKSQRIITESLRLLSDRVRADGGEVVLVLAQDRYALTMPRHGVVSGRKYDVSLVDERFRRIATDLGIRYFNLVEALEKREDFLQSQWLYDPHWTSAGHDMATDILIEYLDREKLLPTDL